MSAPQPTLKKRSKRTTHQPSSEPGHIHLPSVHIRSENGAGFDYEEDYYLWGRRIERIVRFVAFEPGGSTSLFRETFDELCPEDMQQLKEDLPILMDRKNPVTDTVMQECARKEFARQMRIAAGEEAACNRCGCSETRSCSGGCCWATTRLCSRCI
jgi:hypothetical protein